MSFRFYPVAAFWRSIPAIRSFVSDIGGIVTVQMVMFSIMLFGGVGLMMDFGRAYSAHSQMQGYVDQVALAAAEQLDGKSDAIARATTAANSVVKRSTFIKGDGSFQLKKLTFMTEAPTGSNGKLNRSLVGNFATDAPELAKYVLAEAKSSSVAVKLLRFASQDSSISDINIGAHAVATVRNVSCGGLTPLVMCNPYETSQTTSWQEEIKNGIGYRMKLTANDTNFGKPSNYEDGVWKHIRLGLLKRPDLLMNVRNTICTNISNLPGSTSPTSDELRRDICMLATIEAGLSCVNDRVAYRAAHPEAVTTGLGVVFDMYDDAMADIVDASQDFSFSHTFPASLGWPTSITRSSLFYPDTVVGHGRMRRDAFDIYLDNKEYEINNTTYNTNALINNFIKNGHLSNLADLRSAYGQDSSIQWSSRKNHPFDTGKRTEWGPAQVRACLAAENCDVTQNSTHPTIYQSEAGVATIENYAASLYAPYLLQQVAASDPVTYPQWWTIAGTPDVTSLVDGHSTYYGFYSQVERTTPGLQAENAIAGHQGNDGTGAWITVDYQGDTGDPDTNIEFDDDDIHYGTAGTQMSPINYPSVYGALSSSSEERRVQRVAVVNCEAAASYSAATGDNDPAYDDTYVGDIVDVVDLFMVTPPQVTGCTPALTLDPDNNYLCDNADVSEVHLDMELVSAASINSVNFDARNYAVLVH